MKSSGVGHLSFPHSLTSIDNAAINIFFYRCVCVCEHVFISFGYVAKSGIAGSNDNSINV